MLSSSRLRTKLNVATGPSRVRRVHTRRVGSGILGIRREDPQRIWERRCPLTPEAVERLVHEDGIDVLVQPCERRIFRTEDFVKAGAKVHPTLAPADVIIGIKETPLEEILTDLAPSSNRPRTHIMFSHTHKGQEYNAPLLCKFLADSPSSLPALIDWELLTDGNGKRTVGFGWYAGVAGALEGLVSTAHLHLQLGVASPFLGTPRPHTAPLPSLLASLRHIGNTISRDGTPQSMGPFIVVVTGSGQVSNGALHLLRETLPVQSITVEELPKLVRDSATPLNKIYLLHATQEKYLFNRLTGECATRDAYYANPENFESRFHELIAPYTTLLVNGVGWTSDSPRLMTVEQTAQALMRVRELQEELLNVEKISDSDIHPRNVMKGRCQSYADVSCDIEGGLGFLTRSSTLSEPYFTIDLPTAFPYLSLSSLSLPQLQMMSVDILPTALPLEASESFCKGVVPYIRSVARRYGGSGRLAPSRSPEEKEIQDALERATVASGGKLRERHQWLQGIVDKCRNSARCTTSGATAALPKKKRILLLGSGMVAGPTVDEICRRKDVELIVASDQVSRNNSLCKRYSNASPVTLVLSEKERVAELIKNADVVISLLPVPLHPTVAELCIEHQCHLVTASYISPDMRALHERAANSNVLLLNEIGLDPGIDHCSALALLESLRREGKKVVSFTSFCGGLPAPECTDVPLRYKFSWSPRGVLSAALNSAQFLIGGKTMFIPSENLLHSSVPRLPVSEVLQLEGLPNRDSLFYSSTYDLQESDGLQTLFRGTIRYPGFCDLLSCFKQLGLLDTDRSLRIRTYSDLIRTSIADLTGNGIDSPASLASALRDLTGGLGGPDLMEAVEWLSRADDMPNPSLTSTPVIDLFATLLAHRLAYKPGERDIVVLHHEIITSSSNPRSNSGSLSPSLSLIRDEVHTSSLEVYGNSEHSAMALCVGLPVALAAFRVLDGGYKEVGVQGPNKPAMYDFVLQGMEERGLKMKHRARRYAEVESVEGRLKENWS